MMLSCARKVRQSCQNIVILYREQDRVKEEQEGKEYNAFHLDDNSKDPNKTHNHDHDELPMDMMGAEKTFQVSIFIFVFHRIFCIQANMRGFLVILALSLHAVFEVIFIFDT